MFSREVILIFVVISVLLPSCTRSGITRYNNIDIDTTSTLYAFYPNYEKIKWLCSDSPDMRNDSILFCCTSASSMDYSTKIDHNKICGAHINNGVYHEGYNHHLINGGFVYSNGEYTFLRDSLTERMKSYEGVLNSFGFCQMRLDTTIVSIPSDSIFFEKLGVRFYKNLEGRFRLSRTKFKYRALCEKDDKLCIIESREEVSLTEFRKNLKKYGVTNALYLDTGTGWSYSWYRDNNNDVRTLHPHLHPFITNWLIFYK